MEQIGLDTHSRMMTNASFYARSFWLMLAIGKSSNHIMLHSHEMKQNNTKTGVTLFFNYVGFKVSSWSICLPKAGQGLQQIDSSQGCYNIHWTNYWCYLPWDFLFPSCANISSFSIIQAWQALKNNWWTVETWLRGSLLQKQRLPVMLVKHKRRGFNTETLNLPPAVHRLRKGSPHEADYITIKTSGFKAITLKIEHTACFTALLCFVVISLSSMEMSSRVHCLSYVAKTFKSQSWAFDFAKKKYTW